MAGVGVSVRSVTRGSPAELGVSEGLVVVCEVPSSGMGSPKSISSESEATIGKLPPADRTVN